MTTTFAVEPATPTISSVFQTVVRSFRTLKARRTQRLALRTLIEMDASRLDDLGINVEDIRDAINAPHAGATLANRRAARASNWVPNTVPAV
jgi:uncharacterized protein YjiS (DUF1127 family)